MSYKEILETVITELTEQALVDFRQNNLQSKELLSAREKLKLTPEVEEYVEKIYQNTGDEKDFLYLQGAKDCVLLLKKLGILA